MGIFLFDVPFLYEIYPTPIWQTHCIENVIGLDPGNTFIDMKKREKKNDWKRENQELSKKISLSGYIPTKTRTPCKGCRERYYKYFLQLSALIAITGHTCRINSLGNALNSRRGTGIYSLIGAIKFIRGKGRVCF